MTLECPNCQKKTLIKRGANLLKNIRKREVDNKYAKYYCENCEKTYDEEVLDTEVLLVQEPEGNDATDW